MTATDPALMDEIVELVRQAGERTLRWFRSNALDVERKGDGTPVTAADREAERFLREEIGRRWPDDAVVGEEEGDTEGTSGRRWVIDPIDGTKAFTHGVPLYSNLLSFEDAEGPAVAVVNLPALGQTVYAGRGLGCFEDGEPVHVSDRRSLGGSYLTASTLGNWPEGTLHAVQQDRVAVRTWGDGYGYALVATGRVEAMVDHQVALWDVAPMPLLLAEAGGRFTSLDGREGAGHGSGLATNGHLHDILLAVLAGEV